MTDYLHVSAIFNAWILIIFTSQRFKFILINSHDLLIVYRPDFFHTIINSYLFFPELFYVTVQEDKRVGDFIQ